MGWEMLNSEGIPIVEDAASATEQGADATDITGPMVQARVNDTPQSYINNTIQPLSLDGNGQLRVVLDNSNSAWGYLDSGFIPTVNFTPNSVFGEN